MVKIQLREKKGRHHNQITIYIYVKVHRHWVGFPLFTVEHVFIHDAVTGGNNYYIRLTYKYFHLSPSKRFLSSVVIVLMVEQEKLNLIMFLFPRYA